MQNWKMIYTLLIIENLNFWINLNLVVLIKGVNVNNDIKFFYYLSNPKTFLI